ncbi:MAG: PAS domain S-box protein [Anaerolineae bacterium]|nr:PAS domain S-box protein [Anaerolineae bacterium]
MIGLERIASSSQSLLAALGKLQCGDHLCCLYESEEERLSALLAYTLQGLQAGQKVMCFADANTASHILTILDAQGTAVHEHTARGQLVFLEKESVYLPKGYFDPEDMIDRLRAEEAQALAEGYTGLRVAGEMRWALQGAPGSERLIEYEAKLNRFFPGSHCLALCQYDMRRFPAQILLDILSTHPLAAVGSVLYENFYYIPPEEFLRSDREAAILHRQLKNLTGHSYEAQQLMRAVLDNTQTLMVYMDTRFNIIYVNRAFTQLSGKEAEQYHGKNLFDVFPSQPMRPVLEHALVSGQPQRGCFEDRLGWWDWCLVPIKNAAGGVEALLLTGENVTQRKQAEAALQASEKRFRDLVETSPNCILVVQDGKYVYANPASTRLLGYTPEEFIGMEALSIIHPDDRPKLVERMRSVAQGSPNPPLQMRVIKKDGQVYIAESTSLPLMFNERPAALVISQDITARKQAEEALRLSEARWRALVENAPAIIAHLDTQGNFLFANRTSGVPLEKLIGTPVYAYLPPAEQEKARHAIAQAVEQRQPVVYESYFERPDGSAVWYENRVSPVLDAEQRVASVMYVSTDISERVQTEQALRRGEERFRAVFDQSLAGVADAHGRLVEVSPLYCELLGYSAEELAEMTFQQITHPDDLQADMDMLQRMQRGEIDSYILEKRYLRKDGQPVWVNMHLSAVRDAAGGIYQTVGIFQDITARKRAEEENARLLEQTRTRAEEMSAMVQLSAALRQAQTFNEALPILVEASVAALQAERGTLLLLEEERFRIVHTWGEETACPQPMPDEHTLLQALRGGKIAISLCGGTPVIPIDTQTSSADGDCLLIPLRARENPIGLLALQYAAQRVFSPQQMQLAGSIADMAGNTLQRMRLMARMERMVASRTRDLGMLYEIISAASASFDIHQALSDALARIIEITGSTHGAFYMLDPQNQRLELYVHQNTPPGREIQLRNLPLENSLEGWVVENDQPLLIHDMALDRRALPCEAYLNQAHSYLGTPMHARGRVIGVMSIVRAMHPFNLDEISLLASIADHLGLIVENARLHRQAQLAAVLEERARMARDLHDSATQTLFSAAIFADTCLALAKSDNRDQLQHYLQRLTLATHQTLREMRLMLYQLRPASMQHKGLAEALQERLETIERRAGIEVKFFFSRRLRLNPQTEEALYWIANEALNNATRHSAATQMEVSVRRRAGCAVLQVSDNGNGFDPAAPKRGGMGLISMRQRAEKAGGVIEITSAPRKGSTVTVRIPLEAADAATHGSQE